jgi:hypothetical protein
MDDIVFNKQIGTFIVTGDKLIVTDPCYDRGTWCQGIVENVSPGRWDARIVMSKQGRVASLEVACEHRLTTELVWTELPFEVGVDSGQAGIFDESLYPRGATGECGDGTTFYSRACAATLDDNDRTKRAGIVAEGAVSSSGYGDGSYTAFAAMNPDGRVVGVRVVFIDPGDGQESESEDDAHVDLAEEESIVTKTLRKWTN